MSVIDLISQKISGSKPHQDVVTMVLNRIDKEGALPKQITLADCGELHHAAAIDLFSPRAVLYDSASRKLRLKLKFADDVARSEGHSSVAALLYRAAGRQPQNLRADRDELCAIAYKTTLELASTFDDAARAFLSIAASRISSQSGPYWRLAAESGILALQSELQIIAEVITSASKNENPVRWPNFVRRVLGTTKAIRFGDKRFNVVADSLLTYTPGLRDSIAAINVDLSHQRRMAFEYFNVYRNETAVDVLLFGDINFNKNGTLISFVADSSKCGEPVRLLLPNLRDAQVTNYTGRRIILIENETTFNDYVSNVSNDQQPEIVICTSGQANWAVITLLKLVAHSDPSIPVLHWGDLDLAGVAILRSIRARTGIDVQPLFMDIGTYEVGLPHGLPVSTETLKLIKHNLRTDPNSICSDLLQRIYETGKWIEQETIADHLFGCLLGMH